MHATSEKGLAWGLGIGALIFGLVELYLWWRAPAGSSTSDLVSSVEELPGTLLADVGLASLAQDRTRTDVKPVTGSYNPSPVPAKKVATGDPTTKQDFAGLTPGHYEDVAKDPRGNPGHFVADERPSSSGAFKVTDVIKYSTHNEVRYGAVDAQGNQTGATQSRDVALGSEIPLIGAIFSGFGKVG